MHLRHIAAIALLALPAAAQDGPEPPEDPKADRLIELFAAERRLQSIEKLCLYAIARPYSASVMFVHRVAFETLEGETETDAAVRTCTALSASLKPDAASLVTYCGSCELEERVLERGSDDAD